MFIDLKRRKSARIKQNSVSSTQYSAPRISQGQPQPILLGGALLTRVINDSPSPRGALICERKQPDVPSSYWKVLHAGWTPIRALACVCERSGQVLLVIKPTWGLLGTGGYCKDLEIDLCSSGRERSQTISNQRDTDENYLPMKGTMIPGAWSNPL